MDKLDLNLLFHGIQDAVLNANGRVHSQHLELMDEFFDEENKPIMIQMNIPTLTNEGTIYQSLKVPKLTLVPLTSMKVKEVNLDFKVNLSQIINEPDQEANNIPPRSQKSNRSKIGESDDNLVNVQIRLEGCEPPEGILKINDYFLKQLP